MRKSKYEQEIEARQKADAAIFDAQKEKILEEVEARIRAAKHGDEKAIREHMELVNREVAQMDDAAKARVIRQKREEEWRNSFEFKKYELQWEKNYQKAQDEAKARAKAYREKKKQESGKPTKPTVKKKRGVDEQEEEKVQELRQQFFATFVNDFDKIKGYEKVKLRKDTRKKSKPKAS